MTTEQDNQMRWDRQRRGHYEVWFLMAAARAARVGVWIRYTVEAPLDGHGEPEARLWFSFADAREPPRNVALNRALPLSALAVSARPFELMLGGARLTHGSATGALSGAGHRVSWDLRWTPGSSTLRYLPALAYSTRVADTVVQAPTPAGRVHGVVEVDGRELSFDDDPLVQEHLWGKRHAESWAWGHCDAEPVPGASGGGPVVLEALTARLRRGGVLLPGATLAVLRLGGEELRFCELASVPLNRARVSLTGYQVRARSANARVEATFRCRPEDLVRARYLDPDGAERFCHNTPVADCRIELWRRTSLSSYAPAGSWEARGTARFETGAPRLDPSVSRAHEAVP